MYWLLPWSRVIRQLFKCYRLFSAYSIIWNYIMYMINKMSVIFLAKLLCSLYNNCSLRCKKWGCSCHWPGCYGQALFNIPQKSLSSFVPHTCHVEERWMGYNCNNSATIAYNRKYTSNEFSDFQVRMKWLSMRENSAQVYAYVTVHAGINDKLIDFNLNYLQQQGIQVKIVGIYCQNVKETLNNILL